VLHVSLLLAVVHQLASSAFMHRPLPGDPPGVLYTLHTGIGLASFALVAAFWGWAVIRRGETPLVRLLPWLSPRGVGAVLRDGAAQLRGLREGRPSDADGAVASAAHGLGLLAVTAMAATGAIYLLAPLLAPDPATPQLAMSQLAMSQLAMSQVPMPQVVMPWLATDWGSVSHLALGVHRAVANLVWFYLFAHAGAATLHHLLGSDILARMFWVRRSG
jgi:cytochrome b561